MEAWTKRSGVGRSGTFIDTDTVIPDKGSWYNGPGRTTMMGIAVISIATLRHTHRVMCD
jgi:hypothetical protein